MARLFAKAAFASAAVVNAAFAFAAGVSALGIQQPDAMDRWAWLALGVAFGAGAYAAAARVLEAGASRLDGQGRQMGCRR